ncbi:MAG: Ig-like domain repeat protein [Acidobacteriaceae bacterium]
MSNVASPTPESWWESNEGGLWSSVSNGGKLTSDTTDLCATCGNQALKMDATASGSSAGATWYFDAASTQDLFVLMNGTYQISFWAKTAAGYPLITITAQRFSSNGFNCGTYTQTPSGAWTQYTFTCTASEQASTVTPETGYLSVSVTGGAIYFDNVSFQKVGLAGNQTVLRDEVLATIERFYANSSGGNPGPFRYWIEQNAETLNNWTQPDYAHAPTTAGDTYYIGPGGSGGMQLSLEDYLVVCQAIGAEPYLEVPVTFSTADAAGLIDFLAGSTSTTYGAKRSLLGQYTPWTSVFDVIHLSFCNECWNNKSFPGQDLPFRADAPSGLYNYDYSVVAKAIFAAMRARPSYSASSFDLIMNAQTGVNYDMDSAIQSVSPDSIEIEDYTYNYVSDFSTDSLLWTAAMVEPWDTVVDASDPSNFYQSVHDYQAQNTCGPSNASACNVNIYEWGQGTQQGSIDQQHMDYITAGGGEGVIAALEPLLNMQYDGIVNQSYFALTGYQNTAPNNETAKLWGNTVDMGGATNNVRPQFLALSLVNQSIIGPMYSCPISNNDTFNFAGDSNNGVAIPPGSLPLSNVPLLYSFCFENGSNRSIVLVNSDLTSYHSLSFAGTNPPAGSVTVRQLAPPTLDSLNEASSGHLTNSTPATVAIATSSVTNPTSINLPPHSVTALDYNVPLPGPIFSPAPGIYPPVQSVSLFEPVGGATIYYTTNGSTPTTSSSIYTAPISVSSTETISAIAVTSSLTSSISSAQYSIFPLPTAPVLSIPAGSYPYGQTVSITDATTGAVIYYTTNGTTPTTSSSLYSGPISLTSSETLSAIAVANTLSSSATIAQYTVIPKTAELNFYVPYAVNYGNGVPFQVPSFSTPTPTGAVTISINGTTFQSSTQWYEGEVTLYETTATPAAGWVVGNNTVTASFAGDAIYAPQTLTQTVYFSLTSTSTTLSASNTNPMAGSNITLTATTSPAAAPGTVTFMDGGTTLATVALSGGTAIYSVNTIVAGAHSYTAVYNGSTSYASSTSTAVSVSATAPSYTSLAAATNAPVAGSNLVLTATTTPSAAGGTVTFMEGSTTLGTNILSSGVATLTVFGITSGTHNYTAVYGGSSSYAASTSSAITVTATPATAALNFYVPYAVTYGNGVAFQVPTTSSPNPTGNVTISINGKTFQTSNQWYENTVNFYETSATPTDGWTVGSNNIITAAFAGDSIYAPQTLTQTVTFSLIPTTTTLGASGQTPVVGTSITLTANVAPATSTGTVTFFDGSTNLGTVAMSGTQASYTVNGITVGAHNYTATYSGNTSNASSTSTAVTVTGQPASTTTGLAASNLNPVAGTSETLTATVSPSVATGTVTFLDGGSPIGTGTLSGGVASYTISSIVVGTHTYTASYGGSASYIASSSSSVSVTARIQSTTGLSASNLTPVALTSVTLTATTSPTAATGTITFFDGSTNLGSAILSSGAATYTVTAITGGAHSYTASYGGSGAYTSSTSSTVAVNASLASTTMSLAVSNPTPVALTAETLTVTISPAVATGTVTFLDNGANIGSAGLSNGFATFNVSAIAGGSHSFTATYPGTINYATTAAAPVAVTATPASTSTALSASTTTPVALTNVTLTAWVTPSATTGTVTFQDGGTILGTGTVSGGVATFTVNGISIGAHSYTAAYGGTGNYAASTSSALAVTASAAATTTTLASSNMNPVYLASITLTATTSPSGAAGTVTFMDGSNTLGTGTLSGGVATYTVNLIAVGPHSYTASYGGGGNYSGSTSSALAITAQPAPTTTSVSASNTSPIALTSITLTATTTPPAAAGIVTFYDSGTYVGTGTLSSGTATFVIASIGGGAHSYTATYGGSTTYATSTSSALAVTAQPATTSTALSASNTTPTALTSITLTATTSPAAATGTVTFYDGATNIGTATPSSGVATFTVSSINGGAHSYTASYGGSTNYAVSTSSAVSVTAQAVTTTTALAASSTTPTAGSNITLTATLSPSGATGTVNFFDGATNLGPGTLSGGVATYTVNAILVGPHSYTASYAGSTNYAVSTSSAVSVTAQPVTTTTALTASNTTPTAGTNITLTATLSPTTATGTVTFYDGATNVGTGTLSGGIATVGITAITGGAHSYTASYPGVSGYSASTSSALSVTAQSISSSTTLAASNTSPVAGTNIILTASTSPSAAAGTVNFYDGGVSIGTATLSSGTAAFTVSAITAGTHNYTATYGGNAYYLTSSSTVVAVAAQTVVTTTTTLAASNTSPATGSSVTLTATTSPSTTPGSVTFYDGGNAIGAGALTSGVATYTVSAISGGTHNYTATYGGNSNYAASSSTAVTVTASSGPWVSTTFNEYSGGHALAATAPANDGPGSTWTDSNSDWKYVSGGGIISSGSDLTNPALININQANYAATVTYPAAGAIVIFRYIDPNDYVFAETYSFGMIGLFSRVAGTNTQLATLWTGSPAAPLTVTLNGSTGTITSGGQNASGTIPSSLLTSTQMGFFAPAANFTVSSLSVTLTSQATATTTTLAVSNTAPVALTNITLTATTSPSAAAGTVTFLDGANLLGTGTLSGGTATYTVTAISGGAHSYTASYGGNSSYAASSSAAVAVTASPVATTTTLSASSTTPVALTNITLTATTASSAATGTVTFYDGATNLGTGTLSSGTATFTVTAISGGAHSYTAAYAGSTNYATSTSSALAVTASPAATTNTLSASNTSPAAGASVTLTATLAPAGATGTVTFLDGVNTIGTGTLSGGVATYTVSSIAAGSHSYTASYAGNATYAASASSVVAVTTLTATTTALGASSTNPAVGANITLTATLTPSTAPGTVTFKDGANTLGSSTLNGSGVATYSVTSITAGTHSYTAVYAGNTTYATSTSTAVTVTTQTVATTTALSASSTTPMAGTNITLTATTSPNTASGTATFYDGGVSIGTGTLNGSGVATLTVTAIVGGAHSYTATYTGNSTYAASTSTAVAVNAQAATTTTTLSASNTAPAAGANVTLTATTAPNTATGTVTFYDSGGSIGTGTLNGSGVATFTVTGIAAGSHSYTATYGGSANYASSTSSAVAVSASSGPYISTSFNEYSSGHALNATAPATDGSGSTWTDPNGDWSYVSGGGLVSNKADLTNPALINVGLANYAATFTYPAAGALLLFRYVDANDYVYAETYSFGEIILGTRVAGTNTALGQIWTGSPAAALTVTLNGSTATISSGGQNASGTIPSSLLSGTQTGFFSPSANFIVSSLNVVLTSQATATTTTLAASSTTPVALTSVTLTATTSPSAATGTVTFLDNGVSIGTGTLSGGIATFNVSSIAGGSHSYTASYGGNSSYATSTSAALAVTASPASSTTALYASSTTPATGSSVTLTATTSPSAATGTVTFYDGGISIGTGTLSGGTATFTVSAITVGAHSYTATYGGSTTYATSTSSALSVTAQPATTTTALAASNMAPAVGSSVTLTATTSPSAATGTVTFYDGGISIGTGTLNGSGVATFTVSAITSGTHNYTATYGGNASYNSSTSSAVAVTTLTATTTSLAASSMTPAALSNITLTATTSPSAATGTVTFLDNGVSIGTAAPSSGVANFTVSSIAGGSHSYTATYGGSASYASSTSSALAVTASPAATTTALSASSTTPMAGTSVTLTATTSPSAATGTATFYDGGISIGTGTLNGSGVATFTVTAIAGGAHSYTATYGGSTNYATSTSSAVAVTAQPIATTTALAASNTAPAAGASITLTATIAPSAAAGSVTFYDNGGSIGTGTLNGSGVATFTVSAISAGAHSYTATYAGNASYAASTSSAVAVSASSGPYISTTFNEFSGGHALNATAPATDGSGSAWTDSNGDWSYVSGGGVVSNTADLTNPALINVGMTNYIATYTYPAAGALLLFRYVDANDYLYAETYSFGAIVLGSRVGGANTELGIIWTGSPAAPLTVTLNGSTATISSGGQNASGTIPSSLLSGTQTGFFSPSANFTISSLSIVP